jgi:hypothetical protein
MLSSNFNSSQDVFDESLWSRRSASMGTLWRWTISLGKGCHKKDLKTETERERERGRRDIFAHPQMQKNALYIPQAVAGFRRAMLEIQQTPESPVDPHVTSMSHPTAPKLSLSILSKQ